MASPTTLPSKGDADPGPQPKLAEKKVEIKEGGKESLEKLPKIETKEIKQEKIEKNETNLEGRTLYRA